MILRRQRTVSAFLSRHTTMHDFCHNAIPQFQPFVEEAQVAPAVPYAFDGAGHVAHGP